MESNKLVIHAIKLYVGVIFLQFGRAVNYIIVKSALNEGMSHYTYAVYRNIIATLLFAPFAFFFERKIRPKMTISHLYKIALLGLLEPVCDLNITYAGLRYTTATFSTALGNLLPVLTFLLALLLRLEKVNIRRIHSQAKVFGTLVTVGGAMIMTLLRGTVIEFPWTKHKPNAPSAAHSNDQGDDPIMGALLITAGCSCFAAFHILQVVALKSYPAGLSLTTLICMAGALQGTILTLIVERGNAAIWSIHWDSKLLACVYSGIICSGVSYYISGVLMKERGPVFVTAFSPLTMVIVAVMASFVLAEQLYFGRFLGSVIIVIGLYIFIWGKSKDQISSSASNCNQITHTDQAIDPPTASPQVSTEEHIHNTEVSSKIVGERAV